MDVSYMLDAQVVPTVVKPQRIVRAHFLRVDQFNGLAGSFGPSKETMRFGSAGEEGVAGELSACRVGSSGDSLLSS